MQKRIIAMLLVLMLVLGMFPSSAIGADGPDMTEIDAVIETAEQETMTSDEVEAPVGQDTLPENTEDELEASDTATSVDENNDEVVPDETSDEASGDVSETQSEETLEEAEPTETDVLQNDESDEETEPVSEPVEETEPIAEDVPAPDFHMGGKVPIGWDGPMADSHIDPATKGIPKREIVRTYAWCDPKVYLTTDKYNTPFPYVTTCNHENSCNTASGTLYFCIDYAHPAGYAGSYTDSNATDVKQTTHWREELYDYQRRGITYALIYGMPSNCGDSSGKITNDIYGYAATQVIIWEYEQGWRTDATHNSKPNYFSTTLSNSKVKAAYDRILSLISLHETRPVFTGTGYDASTQTVTLNGYGKSNGVTLTTATASFQNDIWYLKNTAAATGLHIEQNGNTLLIYADNSFKPNAGPVEVSIGRNFPVATGTGMCVWKASQLCITGIPDDPSSTSFKVQMKSTVTIKKEHTGGGKIAQRTFKVYKKHTCQPEDLIATYKTDGNGNISFDFPLAIGESIYIVESDFEQGEVNKPDWDVYVNGSPAVEWLTMDNRPANYVYHRYLDGKVSITRRADATDILVTCTNSFEDIPLTIQKKHNGTGGVIANRQFYIYEGKENFDARDAGHHFSNGSNKDQKIFAKITTDATGNGDIPVNLNPNQTYYIVEYPMKSNEKLDPEWTLDGSRTIANTNNKGENGQKESSNVLVLEAKVDNEYNLVCTNDFVITEASITKTHYGIGGQKQDRYFYIYTEANFADRNRAHANDPKMLAELKTHEDGTTDSVTLTPGTTYYVVEYPMADNEKLDPKWTLSGATVKDNTNPKAEAGKNESSTVLVFTAQAGQKYNIKCANNWKTGYAKVRKVDDNGNGMEGIQFELADGPGFINILEYARTNKDGDAEFKMNLVAGRQYYIREVIPQNANFTDTPTMTVTNNGEQGTWNSGAGWDTSGNAVWIRAMAGNT